MVETVQVQERRVSQAELTTREKAAVRSVPPSRREALLPVERTTTVTRTEELSGPVSERTSSSLGNRIRNVEEDQDRLREKINNLKEQRNNTSDKKRRDRLKKAIDSFQEKLKELKQEERNLRQFGTYETPEVPQNAVRESSSQTSKEIIGVSEPSSIPNFKIIRNPYTNEITGIEHGGIRRAPTEEEANLISRGVPEPDPTKTIQTRFKRKEGTDTFASTEPSVVDRLKTSLESSIERSSLYQRGVQREGEGTFLQQARTSLSEGFKGTPDMPFMPTGTKTTTESGAEIITAESGEQYVKKSDETFFRKVESTEGDLLNLGEPLIIEGKAGVIERLSSGTSEALLKAGDVFKKTENIVISGFIPQSTLQDFKTNLRSGSTADEILRGTIDFARPSTFLPATGEFIKVATEDIGRVGFDFGQDLGEGKITYEPDFTRPFLLTTQFKTTGDLRGFERSETVQGIKGAVTGTFTGKINGQDITTFERTQSALTLALPFVEAPRLVRAGSLRVRTSLAATRISLKDPALRTSLETAFLEARRTGEVQRVPGVTFEQLSKVDSQVSKTSPDTLSLSSQVFVDPKGRLVEYRIRGESTITDRPFSSLISDKSTAIIREGRIGAFKTGFKERSIGFIDLTTTKKLFPEPSKRKAPGIDVDTSFSGELYKRRLIFPDETVEISGTLPRERVPITSIVTDKRISGNQRRFLQVTAQDLLQGDVFIQRYKLENLDLKQGRIDLSKLVQETDLLKLPESDTLVGTSTIEGIYSSPAVGFIRVRGQAKIAAGKKTPDPLDVFESSVKTEPGFSFLDLIEDAQSKRLKTPDAESLVSKESNIVLDLETQPIRLAKRGDLLEGQRELRRVLREGEEAPPLEGGLILKQYQDFPTTGIRRRTKQRDLSEVTFSDQEASASLLGLDSRKIATPESFVSEVQSRTGLPRQEALRLIEDQGVSFSEFEGVGKLREESVPGFLRLNLRGKAAQKTTLRPISDVLKQIEDTFIGEEGTSKVRQIGEREIEILKSDPLELTRERIQIPTVIRSINTTLARAEGQVPGFLEAKSRTRIFEESELANPDQFKKDLDNLGGSGRRILNVEAEGGLVQKAVSDPSLTKEAATKLYEEVGSINKGIQSDVAVKISFAEISQAAERAAVAKSASAPGLAEITRQAILPPAQTTIQLGALAVPVFAGKPKPPTAVPRFADAEPGVAFRLQAKTLTSQFRTPELQPQQELRIGERIAIRERESFIRQVPAERIQERVQERLQERLQPRQQLREQARLQITTPVPTTFAPPARTPPPELTKTPGIPIPFGFRGRRPGQKKGNSFDVYVKRKGKFVKVSENPYTRSQAEIFGANLVDRTEDRTFQLRPSSRRATRTSFKRRAGKSKFRAPFGMAEQFDTFVERDEFAIDTPGEVRKISVPGRQTILEQNLNVFGGRPRGSKSPRRRKTMINIPAGGIRLR